MGGCPPPVREPPAWRPSSPAARAGAPLWAGSRGRRSPPPQVPGPGLALTCRRRRAAAGVMLASLLHAGSGRGSGGGVAAQLPASGPPPGSSPPAFFACALRLPGHLHRGELTAAAWGPRGPPVSLAPPPAAAGTRPRDVGSRRPRPRPAPSPRPARPPPGSGPGLGQQSPPPSAPRARGGPGPPPGGWR